MSSVLITGGSGMLGSCLKKYFPDADFLNGRRELDLSYPEIWDVLHLIKPYDVIIHTAAYTDLSVCEKNKYQAYFLHAEVVKLLQKKCRKLIYISAQGKAHDKVYYLSKILGEDYTLERENDLVIRTNIYGNQGLARWCHCELTRNKTINGFSNVLFNPLSVDQLSKFIKETAFDLKGIIHTGSASIISKYDFLKILALRFNLNHDLIKSKQSKAALDVTVDKCNSFYEFNLIDGLFQLRF